MKSIKAILAGSLFIIIVTLVVQLITIFVVVGYTSLAKSWPFLHEISIYFRYLVGYPIFFLVLFVGGYITAAISEKKILLHCSVVGFITISMSTISASGYMELTLTGMVMVLLALLSIIAGGLYWQKNQNAVAGTG